MVIVDGFKSSPSSPSSGVPQGSVLGPLIFLILVSDIDSDVKFSILKSFADDTRVTKIIVDIIDSLNLQKDLNKIYEWAKLNNMEFNDSKFELLRYGKNDSLKTETNYLSSNMSVIVEKEQIRDLGVIMTNDGTFKHHILQTIDSAKQQSSWVLRTFKTRAEIPMLTLWKSLVLPKLEYCSQFSPVTYVV